MLIQISCQLCGMTMKTEEMQSPSLAQLSVEPCPACAERIREASHRAGYEEGYNNGYDDGRTAYDAPLAATFDLGYDIGYMACSNAWGELRGYDEDFVSRMTAGVWCNSWGEPG